MVRTDITELISRVHCRPRQLAPLVVVSARQQEIPDRPYGLQQRKPNRTIVGGKIPLTEICQPFQVCVHPYTKLQVSLCAALVLPLCQYTDGQWCYSNLLEVCVIEIFRLPVCFWFDSLVCFPKRRAWLQTDAESDCLFSDYCPIIVQSETGTTPRKRQVCAPNFLAMTRYLAGENQ